MRAARVLAVASICLGVILSVAAVGGADAASRTADAGILRLSFPKRAQPGKPVTVRLSSPRANDACALSVRYADGATRSGFRAARVGPMRIAWTWKLQLETLPGPARVSVACRPAGRISGVLRVERLPLAVDVVEQGFSTRAESGRSEVSYGVTLVNRSRAEDALDVSVLVNFVTAGNVLVGSETTVVDAIPAGAEFNLGDSARFEGSPAIARLEVVVSIGDRQPAVRQAVPAVGNVRVLPDRDEPTWVDEVVGDMVNVSRRLDLSRVRLSVVLLNGAGDVIGGGNGSSSGVVPPGARQFVKVSSGLAPVPAAEAATAPFSNGPTDAWA
jgi:hypothetical protein